MLSTNFNIYYFKFYLQQIIIVVVDNGHANRKSRPAVPRKRIKYQSRTFQQNFLKELIDNYSAFSFQTSNRCVQGGDMHVGELAIIKKEKQETLDDLFQLFEKCQLAITLRTDKLKTTML
ncbi:hypothetical protein Tsp_09545 [Trichinella spiralis]|uniref:hypothetical protein n=1 Tax=Trichinella spiralis TaxID=6334 RepID=UPI0001EFDB73|nr:hypothetical protein Tsp_09545 [Trichinella spiralis]